MTIEFHLTGETRKTLVNTISELLAFRQYINSCRLVLTKSGNVTPSPKRATLKSAIQLTARKQNTSWKN